MCRTLVGVLLLVLVCGDTAAAMERTWIHVVGSSTIYPLATAVAERFARATDHRAPVVESTGTGGGFIQFCAGTGMTTPDIVTASRRMRDTEKALCRAHNVEVVIEIAIGFDGIVAIRAVDAARLAVDRRQLRLAIAKSVLVADEWQANPFRNWNEIDDALPDEKILVFGPPPTSGTRDVLADAVLLAGCQGAASEVGKRETCGRVREDGFYVNVTEADNLVVQRVHGERAALGFVGFNTYSRFHTLVRAIPIEGVMPDHDTIRQGRYPLARPLFVYVKTAHESQVDGLRDFLAELTREATIGPDGYLADEGLVPLDAVSRAEARKRASDLAPALSLSGGQAAYR